MSTTTTTPRQAGLTVGVKRSIGIAVAVIVLLFLVLGTKVVSNDDPLAQGAGVFDPETFGADNFPAIQEQVQEQAQAVDVLAPAIAADAAAAAEEYAVDSSGGPVFSVTFTGVFGEGASGIYPVDIDGITGDDLLIRVQTGPAINGTELRDATGQLDFGQFTNQIEYQNAAAALNEELKKSVLADIDTASLEGKTVTVTGAFTLINPAAWLVTPVAVNVQ
ncbi:DUF2291 family protein [Microbacterium sp. YY-01]|uniref:DUF2291 family protein n=1 Tax=Microbacterium sp. YY-01 TaxID=3421634 RepID=UPI003D171FA9